MIPERALFWKIGAVWGFYVVAFLAICLLVIGIAAHVFVWRKSVPKGKIAFSREAIKQTILDVLLGLRVLKDEGSVLYKYAEKIFGVVDEMEHALKGFSSLTHGSLIIGTTRSFAKHLMPGLLSHYQEKFPGIKVSLEVGSSSEIAEGVAAFKYDLGIIGRIPLPSKVKAVPYKPEEFCVVASTDHRLSKKGAITWQELQNEPIIIREPGSGSRHFMLSFLASHGVKPSVLVEAGSVEFIKEYVIQGRGISFLYKPEIELEEKMGLLKTLKLVEGPIHIQTVVIVPDGVTLSPPSRSFLELVDKLKA